METVAHERRGLARPFSEHIGLDGQEAVASIQPRVADEEAAPGSRSCVLLRSGLGEARRPVSRSGLTWVREPLLRLRVPARGVRIRSASGGGRLGRGRWAPSCHPLGKGFCARGRLPRWDRCRCELGGRIRRECRGRDRGGSVGRRIKRSADRRQPVPAGPVGRPREREPRVRAGQHGAEEAQQQESRGVRRPGRRVGFGASRDPAGTRASVIHPASARQCRSIPGPNCTGNRAACRPAPVRAAAGRHAPFLTLPPEAQPAAGSARVRR